MRCPYYFLYCGRQTALLYYYQEYGIKRTLDLLRNVHNLVLVTPGTPYRTRKLAAEMAIRVLAMANYQRGRLHKTGPKFDVFVLNEVDHEMPNGGRIK